MAPGEVGFSNLWLGLTWLTAESRWSWASGEQVCDATWEQPGPRVQKIDENHPGGKSCAVLHQTPGDLATTRSSSLAQTIVTDCDEERFPFCCDAPDFVPQEDHCSSSLSTGAWNAYQVVLAIQSVGATIFCAVFVYKRARSSLQQSKLLSRTSRSTPEQGAGVPGDRIDGDVRAIGSPYVDPCVHDSPVSRLELP